MKLADISVKRPVFTAVMMLVLIVFGLDSYSKVGVDQFPNVEFPVVTVTTVYPGADPESVESKVIDPLEESINSVNGIDELRSTSSENVGIVIVRFELSRDADKAVQDVRDKVSAVLGQLPDDVEQPVVQKFDIGAAPIISLVVSGPLDARALTKLADDTIKQRLQTLEGVGNIQIVGGEEREFEIYVDPVALESYGLAISDVAQAIGAQNLDVPGGHLDHGAFEYTLKTEGEVHDAKALSNIIITDAGGRSIRVGDVAQVIDGHAEVRSHASLNGKSAVSLTIQKQSGSNTVAVAKRVRDELAKMKKNLPKGVKVAMPVDNSVFIKHSIDDVQFDLIFGAILAIIIIMVFLRDWRATLISALALPTSVIATIAFIHAMGFTFNIMTMLALTLSIGLLIDDAIVVIENIHRHLEMGKPPMKAALDATNEIGLAVMAITASIIAVFVPVATMKGIIGRFFYQFGMTVAFAVAVSLFVAFTLTPMLSARLLRLHHGERNPLSRLVERALRLTDDVYEAVVRAALNHPIITLLIAALSFVAAMSLFKVIPFEFLPAEDRGEFQVYVELPTGTRLEDTMDYADRITKDIRKMPGVELTFATIGGGAQEEVNKANVHVEMVPSNERSFSEDDAMEYVRTLLAKYKRAKIAVEPIAGVQPAGGQRQGDLQYLLLGDDYKKLNDTADKLVAALKKRPGFVDVDKTSRGGKPEVRLVINRDRAADLHVPVASIGMAIRTLYAGQKVSEVSTDGDRYDARVRMLKSYRNDPSKILDLSVRSATGQLVPLSNIVQVKTGTGPTQIERYNRRRQVTVIANLQGKALGPAIKEVDKLAHTLTPPGVTTALGGRAENMSKTVGYMGEAMLLAIILIFLILSAQFESFLHPLTIMLSLPLSLVGALGALALSGMTLNIFTMIGFIMLMGLVTKNAVLLVDYTNVLREEHEMEVFEALVRAGTVRLRPILMTTAAMIFGMLPVALALSVGGEQRAPMAVAVIGGLITSTLLTLVVVPAAYLLLDRITSKFGRKSEPKSESAEEIV